MPRVLEKSFWYYLPTSNRLIMYLRRKMSEKAGQEHTIICYCSTLSVNNQFNCICNLLQNLFDSSWSLRQKCRQLIHLSSRWGFSRLLFLLWISLICLTYCESKWEVSNQYNFQSYLQSGCCRVSQLADAKEIGQ